LTNLFRLLPGGVARWTSRRHQGQKARVRIPFRENVAMLKMHCLCACLKIKGIGRKNITKNFFRFVIFLNSE
jgi:hypothetical protein